MVGKTITERIALAICAVIIGLGIYGFELGPELTPASDQNLVEIVAWNWRKNVSGRILAVFGTVRNKSPESLSRVILELRIEDQAKNVIARHLIDLGELPANADKPFREDIPRSGKEAKGYLEVKSLSR